MSAQRVLILLENAPYSEDPRVRQEAEALVRAGYAVAVAAPAGEGEAAGEDERNGVRVLTYDAPPGGSGMLGYVREYAVALRRIRSLVRGVAREGGVDVVVTCNPPDFLLLPALPLLRRGAKLVFDHHDLSPEVFEAKFGRRGLPYRLLLLAERFALRRADAVITTSSAYGEVAQERAGVAPEHIFLVRNGPDPARIYPVAPRAELKRGRPHLVVWIGYMSAQECLGWLIDAAEELVRRRGRSDVAFALVGPGDARESLMDEVERRELSDAIAFPGRVEADLLREYLATADVCVSVDERNAMNDRSTMTKVLEYMAMGRAVVQFPLAEMRAVCGDATLYAADADPPSMADRIAELLDDPERRTRLEQAARRRVVEGGLLWPDQEPNLLAAMSTALARD